MCFLGIGEIIGAGMIGRVVDRFGSKVAVMVNLFFVLVQTLIVWTYLYYE